MEDRIRYVFKGFFNVHWRRSKEPHRVPGPHREVPTSSSEHQCGPWEVLRGRSGDARHDQKSSGRSPKGASGVSRGPGTSPKRSEGV